MPKFPYDLGRKSPEGCPCSVSTQSDKDTTYYPSVYFSGPKDLDLPDDGVMTVRFRKNSESSSRPREGKESYDCSVDVLEILSVKGESESKSENRGAELDKLRDEIESE